MIHFGLWFPSVFSLGSIWAENGSKLSQKMWLQNAWVLYMTSTPPPPPPPVFVTWLQSALAGNILRCACISLPFLTHFVAGLQNALGQQKGAYKAY